MAMPHELRTRLDERRARFDVHLAQAFDDVAPEALRDATRWYPDAGGKRLRPCMAILACEAAGGDVEDAMPVALAVELVHNFSLVHDDIMDRDDTRRGRQTVHRRWTEAMAILAGDVLFAKAFEMLTRIQDPAAHKEAASELARVVRKLCEGQALDVAFEGDDAVGVDAYLEMIRGKTALLFEASTRGGALASPRRRAADVEALARYGEAFGMAFQIADDLLDVTATSDAMGKPWGSDVRAGKRTLLVLLASERADAKQRETLAGVLGHASASEADVRRAVEVFEATGALAEARRVARAYADEADAALDLLPPSEAREALRLLNRWALSRGA